jgi:ubiquinone/menaquinone biosynthesis C-methylase UbiE
VPITEQVHDYWNRASCGTDTTEAQKHSRRYFDEIEAYRYKHEPCILSFAQFSDWKDKEVLEVGVGAGTDFLQFVRAGARMHGVDLTEEAIENTSRRLAVYGLPPSDLRVGNAERLPWPNNSFDLVWSWGVIHHADDTEACLREIARVTKSGGRCKVMLYNYNSFWAWYKSLRSGAFSRRKALWHHMESVGTKAYTAREARAMAQRCGLIVQSASYADQLVFDIAKRARRFIYTICPDRFRWFMMLELRKP